MPEHGELNHQQGIGGGGAAYRELALPRFTGPLGTLVDLVARIKVSVHFKLLAGFLVGAVLLMGMGGLSLLVINRMSDSFQDVTLQQEKMDRARLMESAITTQMHFRAIALMTRDDSKNDQMAEVQEGFLENLRRVDEITDDNSIQIGWDISSLEKIKETFERFRQEGQEVLDRYNSGDIEGALEQHISTEHPMSHELEDATQSLVAQASVDTASAIDAFDSDRALLSTVVWSFWGSSLAIALLLGYVLSWSFIRPVHRIGNALADIAGGDFTQQVQVPNRDEFGALGANVNRMSEQLASMFQELRLELAERERAETALSHRTEELAATNQELEAFSYSVSHDLRAPLRGIDGFSQILLANYSDSLDEQGKHYLRRVRSGSQRMGQLIDDLLALSRVSRGEMRREDVDLSEVAKTIAADLQERDPQRKVEFVIQDGAVVNGDPRLLRVALENLLGNAWKFTGKHQQARIEFGLTEHDGQQACFIQDDGSGFDMAYAQRLFGAFQRLHDQNEFEGEGIGLATVQRIISRHGGRVWAKGAPEQGATFYFTLPEGDGQHG